MAIPNLVADTRRHLLSLHHGLRVSFGFYVLGRDDAIDAVERIHPVALHTAAPRLAARRS